MLLAVPLTMLVKVALDNSRELRWLGVAISQGKNRNPELEHQIIKESSQAQKKKEQANELAESEDEADVSEADVSEAVAAAGDGA